MKLLYIYLFVPMMHYSQRLEDSVEHCTWSLWACGKTHYCKHLTVCFTLTCNELLVSYLAIWITDCALSVRWLIGRWLTAVSVCVSAVSPGASQRRSDRVREVPAGPGRRSESSGEKRRAVSSSTSLRTPLSRFHNSVSIFILTESVREDGEHPRENKEVSCSTCSLFHGPDNWLLMWKPLTVCTCVRLCVAVCSCGYSQSWLRSCMLVCYWPSSPPACCHTSCWDSS